MIRSLPKEERELLKQQLFFDDFEPTTYELMWEEQTQQIMKAGFSVSKGE